MATVAIVGGGISGLSTAFYVMQQRTPLVKKILLLEATGRLGGLVGSKRFPDGAVYELGPRSMRPIGKAGLDALAMVEDLGLGSQIVAILAGHPVTKNRLLMTDDKLHTLPSDMSGLLKKKPPFRHRLLTYAIRDVFRKRLITDDDTMYGFAERRFGKEIAELIVDPLCRGVFAGDARKLSVNALLRTQFEAEQKHGSVLVGLIKGLGVEGEKKIDVPESSLGKMAQSDRWAMWSLRTGLESLVEALAKRLREDGAEIRTNVGCKRLELNQKNGVNIETTDGDVVHCHHVFAALPAFELASALRQTDSTYLADELSNIPSVSVGIVTLEFEGSPEELLKKQAFGFLIPSSQSPEILGVTYDSCCFPEMDSNEAPRTRFTAMMGGAWFHEHFGDPNKVDHDLLLNKAVNAVRRYAGIKAKLVRHLVNVHKNCIPQYVVGSSERLKRMQSYIINEGLPISLVGSSYHGVSVNDCIASAKLKAEEFVKNHENS